MVLVVKVIPQPIRGPLNSCIRVKTPPDPGAPHTESFYIPHAARLCLFCCFTKGTHRLKQEFCRERAMQDHDRGERKQ